jgi:predicted ATPase
MLTRLKVSGFKNLVDVDIRFGAFTCLAGANGVGKSNLFDAIRFLSATASGTLLDAALKVRDDTGRNADVRHIFYRDGDTSHKTISFEAEMIIPQKGDDDLGQPAEATSTFVVYKLELKYSGTFRTPLEITHESLNYITQGDSGQHLLFENSPQWRNDVVINGRRGAGFISTIHEDDKIQIQQHQDGKQGRAQKFLANTLPRTILSATNATESSTALLTRRELESWQLLQLEPAILRQSSSFNAPHTLSSVGENLASTLYYLANQPNNDFDVYTYIANQLSELIDDVKEIYVDRDERRELFTIDVTDARGTVHPAKALSDGTLRFLALAVLDLSLGQNALVCLEEPENGIHPSRIPAIIHLLQQIATDAQTSEDSLRQVIINTHSPSVVQQVPEDSLIFVDNLENQVRFRCLSNTWRSKVMESSPLGNLLPYISPVLMKPNDPSIKARVIDRPDVRQLALPLEYE